MTNNGHCQRPDAQWPNHRRTPAKKWAAEGASTAAVITGVAVKRCRLTRDAIPPGQLTLDCLKQLRDFPNEILV
jgi:hypothetical protein